jgi:hypothetical protein
LCELANDTIVNGLTRFYDTSYVSSVATPADVFQSQTKAFINQFESSTVKDFLWSLRIIRDATQANSILSVTQSNAIFAHDGIYSVFIPVTYDNCSCSLKPTCTSSAAIYKGSTNEMIFAVPGLSSGCYTVEALLQSSLICFYNETCLQNVATALGLMLPPEITVMNASASSRYLPNTSVGKLLSNLMVENWTWSGVYADYYKQCEPSECSYTLQSRNDAINIVTTLAGLIGGLTAALKFIVPWVVKFVRGKQARSDENWGK